VDDEVISGTYSGTQMQIKMKGWISGMVNDDGGEQFIYFLPASPL